MSQSEITVFAQTNFRNQKRKFGIKVDDRRRHMYLIGKTGMGKSTVIENMVINDIRAGLGVALVDPHGDLAEKILKFIPTGRVNDVIYFNPSDTNFPVAFNILENISEDYKHLVAYGLVGVFKKIWADSWGPRMEYILTNTILALLDYPGSTLLGVMRMLVDKQYRKKVVAKVQDPVVKTFWADEFNNYSEKFRTEAIAPIQNKVGQFLASSIIRNIIGQSKSTIEMRQLMDEEKILIMNLSKGRVGEENSALLGAMMITKLQIAAMSRVDIPEEDRKDFFLYVDEFQNFATDSFAGILSEARKYRLCLIMAHQYIEQLSDMVKAAVFGNVGTLIVFRVGATDAAEFELEFAPQFTPQDIVNLNKYNFCLRLMIDGVATEPFSASGLPPFTQDGPDNSDKVIKVSRERYARPRHIVEDRIIRWSGVEVDRPNAPKTEGGEEELLDTSEASDDDTTVDSNSIANKQPVVKPTSSGDAKSVQSANASAQAKFDRAVSRRGNALVGPQNFIPDVEDAAASTSQVAVVETSLAVTTPTKPKINFVKTALPEVEDAGIVQAEVQKETIPVSVDLTHVDMSGTTAPEKVPIPAVPLDYVPITVPIKAVPKETIQSKPVTAKADSPKSEPPKVSQPTPDRQPPQTISLSALKDGHVPQVTFSGERHHTNESSSTESGDAGKKRKRRRRKKKSGQGDHSGQGGSSQFGQRPPSHSSSYDSSHNPSNNSSNSQGPAQPSIQPATRSTEPRPQPAPSTGGPPPNPKTQVNLQDLV